MDRGSFEWDQIKAAENYAKHGVTFEAACDVFKDPFAVDWLDDRENHGEERHIVIGLVEARFLFVVYTMRDDAIRIISARGAEPYERRRYHEDGL